ncbi:MAG: 1-acyl-sn-glycerol-3-phosphate acyltransferase [Porticoccaceae bacterium UBA1117]|nr:MAG: 1-acyl-sn-glycerol-3-phosphate acyltransferase [Porticoccaceae bacterium UBA1117]
MSNNISQIVSSAQIPSKYWASRPKLAQWIGRCFLGAFNWKVEGSLPPVTENQNIIIIAGPHTSNWDGVFGFAAILGLDAKITFFGKHSLFTQPLLGRFLTYMGGIPVDKKKPGSGLTDVAIKNMAQLNGSLIVISPEGTRAKTDKLKSGFLRIADAVEGKVFLAAFDFGKKRIVLDSFLDRSKDYEQDIAYVTAYYTNFEGKCPENY